MEFLKLLKFLKIPFPALGLNDSVPTTMVPVGNNQSLSGTGSDVAVKKQRIESSAPGLNGSVPTTMVPVGNQESISGTGSDVGSAVQSGGDKEGSGQSFESRAGGIFAGRVPNAND